MGNENLADITRIDGRYHELPLQPFSRIKQIAVGASHPQSCCRFPRNIGELSGPWFGNKLQSRVYFLFALSTRDRMYEYAVPSQDWIIQSLLRSSALIDWDVFLELLV
jgi:hypothetical protein